MNCLSIISLALMVAVVQADQCQPVVKGPEVNFQPSDAGPWYMTYGTPVEQVTQQGTTFHSGCLVISDGKIKTGQIDAKLTSYIGDGSSASVQFVIKHTANGVYEVSLTSEAELINKDLKLEGKDGNVDEKDITISGQRSLILTDHHSYYIIATCSSKGKWIVWFHTRTPNPTAAQVNAGRAKLTEQGVSAEIFPTKCIEWALEGLLQ